LIQKGDINKADLLAAVGRMVRPGPEPPPAKVRKPAGPEKTKDASVKPRILVVEDNPDNMVTIKAVLQERYRIIEAADGEAGLNLAAEVRPDLILLDMALPKMDGLTMLRRLRENRELASIPVIAMTARVMKGDREEILAAGCDDYIPKPMDPAECLTKIEAWLNK
jgi:CheY-like chemotaxis protein